MKRFAFFALCLLAFACRKGPDAEEHEPRPAFFAPTGGPIGQGEGPRSVDACTAEMAEGSAAVVKWHPAATLQPALYGTLHDRGHLNNVVPACCISSPGREI